MSQLTEATRFFTGLYVQRARREYAARVRRDLPARLLGPQGRINPYPIYEQIRARGTFVPTRLGNLVSADHAVCDEVLRSRRFGVRPTTPPYDPNRQEDLQGSLLSLNPPDHTRLRRIASPAFGPRAIAAYQPLIAERLQVLVDAAEARGTFDLIEMIAAPLPISVITSMLAVPDEHVREFQRYGEAIGGSLEGIHGVRHAMELQRADAALDAIFAQLFELRRREPGDDVVSLVVAAEGDAIHPSEMRPLCQLLLIAGFETTVNALGNAVLAFDRHPEQWERLVADPSLAAQAADEVLRYDSPVQRTARLAFEDVELGGRLIRAGQTIQPLIGGANRDPAVFDRPADLDITRPNAGRHLSFSSGIHYCLGQPLARLELSTALGVLATRLPRLRVAGRPRYRLGTLLRGPRSLPVSVR